MNRRIRKKKWNYYISGINRYGCEECTGITNRVFKTEEGWINLSLGLKKDKKEWKMVVIQKNFDTGEREEICYIKPKYCWNCGRKLK